MRSRKWEQQNVIAPSSLSKKARVFTPIPMYLSKGTAAAHPFCQQCELSAVEHELIKQGHARL